MRQIDDEFNLMDDQLTKAHIIAEQSEQYLRTKRAAPDANRHGAADVALLKLLTMLAEYTCILSKPEMDDCMETLVECIQAAQAIESRTERFEELGLDAVCCMRELVDLAKEGKLDWIREEP